MKKYIVISLLLSSLTTFGQTNTNYGFESWTTVPAEFPAPSYEDPNGWNTLNQLPSGLGTITCTKVTASADIYSGSSAVKLVTKNVLGQVANGLITTGTINQANSSVGGGVPYTLRPDSIIGWYKYSPVSNDSGFCEIQLLGTGGDTDTIGYAIFRTPNKNVSTYTRFSLPIEYRNSDPIVKSIWILSSSVDNTTHYENSTLFCDDIQLGSDEWLATSIQEASYEISFTISPNPASSFIKISGTKNIEATFLLYDSNTNMVVEKPTNNLPFDIYLSNLAPGIYFYSIQDEQSSILKSGKLIIQ